MGDDEVARLRRRLQELERENHRLQSARNAQRTVAAAVARVAFFLVAGRGLSAGVQDWWRAFERTGSVSLPASAEVVAAVVRRVLALGLVGITLTALPIWLLWRQNELLAEQNGFVREQTETVRAQLVAGQAEARLARRAAYVSTLYDRASCARPPCPPSAHVRARAEAAIGLVRLDRSEGRTPDLSGAPLGGAPLVGADLRDVRLDDADLAGADLRGADLRDARLARADLSDARLEGANLAGARACAARLRAAHADGATDLRGVDLESADLTGAQLGSARLDDADLGRVRFGNADLGFASLNGARLAAADLRAVRSLHSALLGQVTYDARTRWPVGFSPP